MNDIRFFHESIFPLLWFALHEMSCEHCRVIFLLWIFITMELEYPVCIVVYLIWRKEKLSSVHYARIINYYCTLIRVCSIRSTPYRKQKTTQVVMLKYFGLSLRLGYSRNFSWNILKSMENNKSRSFVIVLQFMNMILLCYTWVITKRHSSSSYALLLCCTTSYCFFLLCIAKFFCFDGIYNIFW